MIYRSLVLFFTLGLVFHSQAQQTISTNGGFATTENLSVSWTIGQPVQAYLQATENIYTVGYQQPNIVVESIQTSNIKDEPWAHVYPNPVKEELFIQLNETLSNQDISIHLFSANGKPLHFIKTQYTTDLKIDVSLYPSGAYFLHINANNKQQIYSIIKP